jgi:hypothetical protein
MRRQPPQERDVKQPSGERLHDALAFVRARLEALKSVPADPPFNDEFVKWDRLTAAGIQDYFGKDSQEFGWVFVGSSGTVVIRSEAQREALDRKRYPEVLRNRRMGLETVLERYEALPPTWGDQVSPVKRRTRAFISHGGEKPSLTFIQNFLRA